MSFAADQFNVSSVAALGPRSDSVVLEIVGESGLRGSVKLRDCELSTTFVGLSPKVEIRLPAGTVLTFSEARERSS
jgi:hypothetical protein